jgi:hypothetical protein
MFKIKLATKDHAASSDESRSFAGSDSPKEMAFIASSGAP